MGSFAIKRIYEPALPADGQRVLIDRLWPRGISKERAALTLWDKAIAPSTELRTSCAHAADQWDEFTLRYRQELAANQPAVDALLAMRDKGDVTLLYASHDPVHNHARILLAYLDEKVAGGA